MDSVVDIRDRLIPLAVIGGLVFGSAYYLDALGLASLVSMSFVVEFASTIGLDASVSNGELLIGSLRLPWTQDCSGINALVLLLAITLWAGHRDSLSWLLIRLAICFPVALLVNATRIFAIAAYRYWMYPEWESPQLHYFIGFVCLLASLPLIVPSFRTRTLVFWLELLFFAVAMSLAIPAIVDPGGNLVLYCTLLLLATRTYQGLETVPLTWTGGWLVMGILLGASAMEGLWLPWLLLCPAFLGNQWRRAPESLLIVAGTAPVVAMFETAQVVVCLASIVFFLRLLRRSPVDAPENSERRLAMMISGILVLLPFLLPLVMERDREIILPPSGTPAISVAFNTWQLRIPTQSADIRTFWFGPFGDGRHHSLVSCMKFRGIDLKPVRNVPGVYEGNGNWMAEYFIYRGELVDSYGEYLLLSLIPFSTAGVHLILESSTDSVSAAYFSLEARRLADRIALQAQQSS